MRVVVYPKSLFAQPLSMQLNVLIVVVYVPLTEETKLRIWKTIAGMFIPRNQPYAYVCKITQDGLMEMCVPLCPQF